MNPRTGIGIIAAVLLSCALSPSGNAATEAPAAAPVQRIKHVVLIYQENHTFDDEMGTLCMRRPTPCNVDPSTGSPYRIGTPITLKDGVRVNNRPEPDIVPGVNHSRTSQLLAMSNQYDKIVGCRQAPHPCVTHVDHPGVSIPNLARYANVYAVSDATFAGKATPSFGAHVNLGAGTMDGFTGNNAQASKSGFPGGKFGWGCTSNTDAPWGNRLNPIWVPSCIPNAAGAGPYWNKIPGHRPSPVPYVPTIMQQMEQAGLTWHIYQGQGNSKPAQTPLSICTYFWWCQKNRFNNTYDSSDQGYLTAAKNGNLPSLSIMLPANHNSQHNGYSMIQGDNYIGTLVHAAMTGPEWKSTAILITYDDCGCFFDHVKPPAGLGMRNPMVIVSPWVKKGYTDSTTAEQPFSMLSFTDYVFGLPPLTPAVGGAYDYSHSFDFTQKALPTVPVTHTGISERERERLKTTAEWDPDDPT